MTSVVQFPPSRVDRIEIWRGRTKEHPDKFTYFLDLVEFDGGRCCVHDAPTWSEANLAALEWQRDGIRVVDKTGGPA